MTSTTSPTGTSVPPFDAARLDALMDEAGVDVLLATSPHNTRYLLGGHRFFLYELLDGIGADRYLPVVGYVRGAPEQAFFVGAGNEDWATDAEPLWVGHVENASWTAAHAARIASDRLAALGLGGAVVGVEPPYVPMDAHLVLRERLPGAKLSDAGMLLEELRAVKRPYELELLRAGAGAVVDAMLATIADARAGESTRELAERLRLEQTRRGLTFGYCLVTAGGSANRAPSEQRLPAGGIVSLDSGAHMRGYVADLTRMGLDGPASARHEELLAQVATVQAAARAVVRAGVRGGDLFDAADEAAGGCRDAAAITFLAHGTGLLSHEAPRLTDTGSPPYPATHRELPLRSGMVLSIETHLIDAEIGFVKLEDTVVVTDAGCDPCGDWGRGWNPVGG
ncbi:M24 family metallopeptidase [Conexibacter woesei]|uniref:M24 family metallopeptidase n=1 Tax=Conexibacter woesei TaxID=191495 RepID=UPI0011D2A362|nr:Xaa-Pro peptidase family protein [Conexibacter woesei]